MLFVFVLVAIIGSSSGEIHDGTTRIKILRVYNEIDHTYKKYV
jgi:hypothetical protein